MNIGALIPLIIVPVIVAAAAARQRREEEEMASGASNDLTGDYEFKILRATSRTFRKPERLRAILEEEARAGWELVEKFDDARLRLRRPISRRQVDGKLEIDPYRSVVGMNEGAMAGIIIGSVVGLLAALALVFASVRSTSRPAQVATPVLAPVAPIPPVPPVAPIDNPNVPGTTQSRVIVIPESR